MGLPAIADKGAAALMGRIAPIATVAAQDTGDAAVRMAADVGTFATDPSAIIKGLQQQVTDLTSKLADANAQAAADMSSLDQANANIVALNNRVGPAEQKVAQGTSEVSSMTSDFNQGTNALAAYENDANSWMQEANQLLNNVRAHIQNLGSIFGV